MTFRVMAGLLAILAASLTAEAQQGPQYDTATVIDFSAVVTEIREVAKDNPLSGVNLVVKTESDATMGVYLGPVAFLRNFEITFRKGDNIHVVGSKVRFDGAVVVLSREVRKDSATLYLRDRNGRPFWQLTEKPSS